MRLDILIYAHDGRGLGHVSRSLAIGMAVRRLYPQLKILFISGSNFTGELLGNVPLDWLKLPSYKTEVVDGTSIGVHGNSMFSDKELGEIRSLELAHTVELYNPHLVLVDHTPQGKHRELLRALDVTGANCQWILGVRGVVGGVPQAKETVTGEIFKKSYSGLLWYGDTAILGRGHCLSLRQQYGVDPFETGYVARLGEYIDHNGAHHAEEDQRWAGVVSVPWIGAKTVAFLEVLSAALRIIGAEYGDWCLFIAGVEGAGQDDVSTIFSGLKHCHLKPPSGDYGRELIRARSAVIYGGYNSLVDVLYTSIPAIVILREMMDQEQQEHLACLQKQLSSPMVGVSEEEVTVEQLHGLLQELLRGPARVDYGVNANGAECAAQYLYRRLT
ncbi:hypothetical protein LA52FAK_35560 [Desulforhopalus sp. 52FAK]